MFWKKFKYAINPVAQMRLERDAWRSLAHAAAAHPDLARKAGL